MPLGYLSPSGRPHGLSVIAKPFEDQKILGAMHLYENSVFRRQPPPPLIDWKAKADARGHTHL
jgi:Asp-tRNA(Asn)/Glu-tRNA(Gln) amidotransferase A subunit family amidase